MKRYDPKTIEPKWQQAWADSKIYEVREDPDMEKQYVLAMFPYPSGAGLHVGHVRNYSITDTIARFQRQQGKNVLSTIGWDAFGLPAENYAIKTGVKPQDSTAANIANFKTQLQKVGMSFDWTREINTTDPSYYKWTQWIFTQLFDKGLAYQQESLQWWCPTDKTVLANEQVEGGKCWRCGNEVEKKALKQWFFKITDYADQLLDGIDDLVWPEKIKTMQKNWIGRSKGAEIDFPVAGKNDVIKVFTTRPDTIFGATFLVLAPEHPLVDALTTDAHTQEVAAYKKATLAKSDIDRMDTSREKTGVFTGSYATNPLNDEKIPVWIADYVLTGYGTGAIMAVPAHDERDYEFATKFNLPIVEVVAPDFGTPLKDTVEVTGPVVIGYDPKAKKYMSLINTKNNNRWFVSGGLEKGETYEQAALRELKEEAGFTDVKKLIRLGGPTYSYYFNSNKQSNRRSFSYMFLAILDMNKQGKQALESHEQYKVEWSDIDAIAKDFEKKPDGLGHWIDGLVRAKDAASAYELGQEYTGPIFHGDGVLFESGKYSGVSSAAAREQIVLELEKQGIGNEKVQYRMRDWLISRQRYWGAPIPIIHCEKDGPVAVPEKDLPVVLPDVESYIPKGDGSISVLASIDAWVNTKCPTCGGPAKRETDTMDGYACSSWYFLRYNDARNERQAWDPAKANYWMPIDYYCGGDHAVSHLLYSRFWMYFFADQGLIDPHKKEPAIRLVYNGYINAHDGQKMSKSKGNTVDPLELIEQGYGADALRLYELFIAPYELDAAWDPRGIAGTYRFLQRVWTLTQRFVVATETEGSTVTVQRSAHKAIKKVSGALHDLSFNTAIAGLMEYTNELYKLETNDDFAPDESWRHALESLIQLVAPFAPHIAEELWADLGHEGSVHVSGWPMHDETYLTSNTVSIAIQVNGKLRGEVQVASDASQDDIEKDARKLPNVDSYLQGNIVKVIYIPDKIINFVVR